MDSKPVNQGYEFHLGRRQLHGPFVRGFVIDAFCEAGCQMDEVIKIWHAATADPGPDGDQARQLIERMTGVRIALTKANEADGENSDVYV